MLRFNILYLYESFSLCGRPVYVEIVAIWIRMWRKKHFSKLEMKFVGFSVLVSENKIISGEVRKDIYWSFYWYMYKFVHHFSDKLMVLLRYLFFSVIVWISGRSFQMMAEPLMIKYAACRVSLIVLISMNYFYPHGIWARICIPGFFGHDSIQWHLIIYILKVSVIYD